MGSILHLRDTALREPATSSEYGALGALSDVFVAAGPPKLAFDGSNATQDCRSYQRLDQRNMTAG